MLTGPNISEMIADPIVQTGSLAVIGGLVTRIVLRNHPTRRLIGQVVAWRELVAKGFYVSTNPASSFFYIFTAAHGVHLLGGVGALLYVLLRNFDRTNLTQSVAAEVTSHYWHFMDGLWLFLLALLYLGK